MIDPGPHLFWLISRGAGTAALLLSSFGVSIGLLMGGKFVRGRGLDLRATHEAASLATLVAIGIHGGALLGDHFMHPSLADVTVPFASSFKTAWTTLGIVAGWGMAVLGLSYYARRWIGQRRWRSMHRFTVLAWGLGVLHTLGEGTDAGELWFQLLMAIGIAPAVILLVVRLSAPPHAKPHTAAAH